MQFNLSKIFCPVFALSCSHSFKIPLRIWFLWPVILIVSHFWVYYIIFHALWDLQWFCPVTELHVWQKGDFCPQEPNSCSAWPQKRNSSGKSIKVDRTSRCARFPKWKYKTKKLGFLYVIYKEAPEKILKQSREGLTCVFQLAWILHFFLGSCALFFLCASCQKRKMEKKIKSAIVVVFCYGISVKKLW